MKNFFFNWPIRVQLVFLVAIAILPATGVILYSGIELRHEAMEDTRQDSLSLVNAAAERQQVVTESARQFLMVLAKMPEVQRHDSRACNILFKELLPQNPLYANIFFAEREGWVTASAVSTKPHNISKRKYYKDIKKKHEFSTGEYVVGVSLKSPVFHYAYPVIDREGNLKGLVAIAFDLKSYAMIIEAANIPEGSTIELNDHRGMRLYRYPQSEKYLGQAESPQIMRHMSGASDTGTFIETGADGIRRFYAYKRFNLPNTTSPYMYMRLGIPEKEALAPARSVLNRNLAVLGIVFVIALASVWYLGGLLIAMPLNRLVFVTRRFKQGMQDVMSHLPHTDNELGQLVESFDEMTSELISRDDERRKAEEELREREALLRIAGKTAKFGGWSVNVATQKVVWSDEVALIHEKEPGHSPSVEDAASYYAPEWRERIIRVFNDCVTNGNPYDEEMEIITGSGRRVWVHTTGEATRDDAGAIIRVHGSFQDITERKRVERELKSKSEEISAAYNQLAASGKELEEKYGELEKSQRQLSESEERYKTFVEQSFAGVYVVQNGMFIFLNIKAASYADYLPEELIGKKADIIIHSDDRAKVKERANKMLRGEDLSPYEFRIISKGGQIRWIMETVTSVVYGDSRAILGNSMDITDHKWTEEALQASKKLEMSIFSSVPHGLFGVENRRISFANEAMEKIFGWTPQELIGKSTRIIFRNDREWEEYGEMLYSILRKKPSVSFEPDRPFVRKDGKEIYCRNSVSIIGERLDENNKIVATFEDITESRRIIEALLESEERYRRLFETMIQGVVYQDADGRIISANPAAEKILGLSLEQMMGKTSLDPGWKTIREDGSDLPGHDHPAMVALRTGKSSENFIMGVINQQKNEYRWIRIDAIPLFQPGKTTPIRVYTTFDDITAELLAEQEYRTLFNEMLDGFALHEIICDAQGCPTDYRFLSINPAFEHMTGLKAEDILGRTILEVLPETEQYWIETYGRVALTGEPTVFESYHGGLDKHFSVTAYRPAPNQFACIFSDTTVRRRAEEKQKELESKLQRAEKMEALGLLAGGVAHDLNNALGILVGYAELLYDDLSESDTHREDARNIIAGGEQAAAIVQDLLTLARRGVQTKAVVNVNKIIAESLKSPECLKLTTIHPDIRIKTDLDEELLQISGSRVHLSKSLMNLLYNAAEAMTSGGEIVIRTENRYLDRPVSGYDELCEGDYAVLSVSDEGEGISDDDMKRIFEPFYTKKVMGRSGTGLGLSVVWGTVKDHNGYIDVCSSKGKGTVFSLYFPVTHEAETGREARALKDEYLGRGETILVVDDIRSQRELASRILMKLDYKVETAASGEDAVEFFKTGEADLIILDMIMEPGIDGFETYRRISEFRPKQKAIIVSGFAETERVKMAQSLGAGTFVKKPYIRERIGVAVRHELDRN